MKKSLVLLLVFLTFLLPAKVLTQTPGFESSAEYAALIEFSTGRFLYLKNENEPRPPASITKLMTLLLAFEALEREDISWEQKTLVSEKAWRMGGSEMYLEVDTEVTVKDLINGISIVSANDGCIAIAELIAGSEEAFVQLMNRRAAELGLENTHFVNSTGLPADNHYMSARDVAILAWELITRYPKVLEFESQREFTYGGIRQYNRNPLLGRFAGADGLKTGWTPESGYSLVGTAVQKDMRLISVVLNTESDEARLAASQELLTYGFRNFEFVEIAAAGEKMGEITVKGGKKETVDLIVDKDYSVLIPVGRQDELELVITDRQKISAPVEKGEKAAALQVKLDGETLDTQPLFIAEDVDKANFFVRLIRAIVSLVRGLFNKIF